MSTYAIYVNPTLVESVLPIKSSFSFTAFIFGIFWAIYHKMWDLMLLLLIINLFIVSFQSSSEIYATGSLLQILVSCFIGIFASDLMERKLQKKGYKLKDVVYAADEDEAYIKFISRQTSKP